MEELQELVEVAKNSMEEIDLADGYIKALGCVWNIFGRWLDSKGLGYSPDVGRRFLLEEYGIGSGDSSRLSGVDKRRRRAMAVLENCYKHEPYHRVEDRRYETFFAACHESVFTDFLDDVAKTVADSTLCSYAYTLNRLSPFLELRGVTDVRDIDSELVVRFVEETAASGVGQQTVYATTCRLRRFCNWLCAEGYVDAGVARSVPKAKPPQKKIPDVYTDGEIAAMLGAIDTANPTGKRNLVACLLAARVGMRASDIVNLEFGNLYWKRNTIEFATAKTGQATVLPLTNEIGDAIIDYARNGRPMTDVKNVLVSHGKPHARMHPALVHGIVGDALNAAGIARDGRRRGPHALRASVATGMMVADVPLPTISAALSHSESDTTRIYLKVDVEKLRSCALEVKPLVNTWWKKGNAR